MGLRARLRRMQQMVMRPRLKRLPGTSYQAVLLPLEYEPSRDYRPRWSYSRPKHAGLTELMAKGVADYLACLQGVAALQHDFSQIPKNLAEAPVGQPGWVGGALNALDAAVLYYFMVTLKPNVYLEIGSGVSTLFAVRARTDYKLPTRVISIDPEPRMEVDRVCDQVVRQGLETADLRVFDELNAGDIVYMDGSHRSFMNSDVTVFMLDVLPKIKPGVVVQIHDVHLPHDYPPMFANWYWNEQYLLAVYLLAAGPRAHILMPCAYLSNQAELKQAMAPILAEWSGPPETWLYGGSFWFTKTE